MRASIVTSFPPRHAHVLGQDRVPALLQCRVGQLARVEQGLCLGLVRRCDRVTGAGSHELGEDRVRFVRPGGIGQVDLGQQQRGWVPRRHS